MDTRVTLANPVAGYSSYRTRTRHFSDLGDSEQTPSDLATIVDYTHLTAMMAPRGLLLTKNRTDNCCFASAHALPPLLAAARPAYAQLSAADRLRWHINDDPGDHNFQQDNRQALYRMIRDQFYDGDQRQFPTEEIACEDELQTADQLQVPLPPDNLDFSQLAAELARHCPGSRVTSTADEAITCGKSDRSNCGSYCERHPTSARRARSTNSNWAVSPSTAGYWAWAVSGPSR